MLLPVPLLWGGLLEELMQLWKGHSTQHSWGGGLQCTGKDGPGGWFEVWCGQQSWAMV